MNQKLKITFSLILCTILLISCNEIDETVTTNQVTPSPISDKQESDVADTNIYDTSVVSSNISEYINDYTIIDDEFVEDGVSIIYPQITGLMDTIKQDNINDILKNEAMVGFDYYDRKSTDLDLSIEYNISWMSQNLLSVKYSGFGYGGSAAYPTSLFYTVNIDMNAGSKVVLSDYINIDQNFVEKYMNYREPEESMTNYALEDMLSDTSADKYLDDFRKADSAYDNKQVIFSYFTQDALGISIDVSHTFGGHIEIELKYTQFKDNIITDSVVWNDFVGYLQ